MLSFLADSLCSLGGNRSRPLAQGNVPPVAVNDPRTVLRGSGPVTVTVLGNDVDPEGQPLTLVSAFAALGTAVAGTDGTVTYTPPQGEAAATVDFDTVVYEIEDVEGARDTGQIDITISDPEVEITVLPDNTLNISAGTGPVEIAVTSPAGFAGTHGADLGDLASGPVNLVRPGITGTIATGEVLTARDGLWIHDAGAGTPVLIRQWQRGGVDIPGETGAAYTVVTGDATAGIGLVETLTDAFGSRGIADALAGFTPLDDPLLVGWWDASETATITETAGAVSDWAARAGGVALVQTNLARQPTTGIRSLNGRNVIDFDGGDHLQQDVTLPASGNVAFHMVLEIDAIDNAFAAILAVEAMNDFQIDANNAAAFDGRFNATGIGTTVGLAGGPFAGPVVLSVICDLTGAGEIEILIDNVSVGTAAYTAAIDAATTLHVMTNRSRNAWIDGAVAEIAISGDVANRGAYHGYLAEKWGLV